MRICQIQLRNFRGVKEKIILFAPALRELFLGLSD